MCKQSQSKCYILRKMYKERYRNTKKIASVWRSQLANSLQRCLDQYQRQEETCIDVRQKIELLSDKVSLIEKRLQGKSKIGYEQQQNKFHDNEPNNYNRKNIREQTGRHHRMRSESSQISKSLPGKNNNRKKQQQTSMKKASKLDQYINQQKRKDSQRKKQYDILMKYGYENIKKFKINLNKQLKKQYSQTPSFQYQPFCQKYWRNQKEVHCLKINIKFVSQHLNFLRRYHQENQQRCLDQYFIDMCKDGFFRAKNLLEQLNSAGNTLVDQNWQLLYAFYDSFQKFMRWLYDFVNG